MDTMKISGQHISLDAPFNQTEENSLLDVIENENQDSPDNYLLDESLSIEIKRALRGIHTCELKDPDRFIQCPPGLILFRKTPDSLEDLDKIDYRRYKGGTLDISLKGVKTK